MLNTHQTTGKDDFLFFFWGGGGVGVSVREEVTHSSPGIALNLH